MFILAYFPAHFHNIFSEGINVQLFTLLGGLGLFLYGMQLLSGALTELSAQGPAAL